MRTSLYLIIIIIFTCFKTVNASNFIDKGFYVIDLKNKIEWLKCSAGQQWSDKNNKCVEHYTEGDNNDLLPFNTLNNNKEEEMKIQDWATKMYHDAQNDSKDNTKELQAQH